MARSAPSAGAAVTVKALAGGAESVSRSSSKVTVSVAPSTAADANPGAVVSTLWPASGSRPAWASAASAPAAERSVPPSSSSVSASTATPPVEASPETTV